MKNRKIDNVWNRYLSTKRDEIKALNELDFAYMIGRIPDSEYCRISEEIKEVYEQTIKNLTKEEKQ